MCCSQLQDKSTGIKFSWLWKPPLIRLSQLDYWWTSCVNAFNDRLFEALREKKKKKKKKKKKEKEKEKEKEKK
jgi:hypothetical protein